jgi:hypothetical protein
MQNVDNFKKMAIFATYEIVPDQVCQQFICSVYGSHIPEHELLSCRGNSFEA